MSKNVKTTTIESLVTVIAVCYNHSRYVIECLNSIRNQTYQSIQLIIMDDYSKDDSVKMIRSWIEANHVQCEFIPHVQNKGLCRTLNEALLHATGEFISIISTDDMWLENKVEEQIKVFSRSPPSVGVVYGDAYQIDANGELLESMFMSSCGSQPQEGNIFPMLLERNFISAPSVLIRCNCYETVGIYDENLSYEDYDMWLRISQKFEFAFCPIVLTKYRILSSSLSRKTLPMLEDTLLIFKNLLIDASLEKYKRPLILSVVNHYYALYRHQYPKKRMIYAWKMFKYEPGIRTLLLFFMSLFRFDLKIQDRIFALIEKIKKCRMSS